MEEKRNASTQAGLSLRVRLVRTTVATLGAVAVAMLATVAWMDFRTARQTFQTIEVKIRDSIVRKGRGLVTNHALALRGLVADNAFSDVARLVQGAVREDEEITYGLFLGSTGRAWAYVPPVSQKKEDENAWKDLKIDPNDAKEKGVRTSERHLFEQNVFEFSTSVEGDDGVTLGRIFYGLSVAPLEQALAQARATFKSSLTTTLGLLALLGLGTTLLGFFLIAGATSRITRPLAQLTEATTAIAGGRRDVRVVIESGDEIGVLGGAFNQMVDELNDSYEQLATLNRTLEQRVEDRTLELAGRNRDMRLVLDNVNQGFLTISKDGVLAQERSAIVDRWFGSYEGKIKFADYLGAHDREFAESFELGFEALLEEVLPLALCVDQLPRRISAAGKGLSCAYFAMTEGTEFKGLLIVINDVTDEIARARQDGEQRELVSLFQGFTHDRSGLSAFFEEANHLMEDLDSPTTDVLVRKRLLHTIKGNAAISGLGVVADLCHRAEDHLAEDDADGLAVTLAALKERWTKLNQVLKSLQGERGRSCVEVPAAEIDRLIQDVQVGLPAVRVITRLSAWRLEPAGLALSRLGQQARSLAQRLGKGEIDIDIDDHGVRIDPRRWTPLWTDLVHVIRNAVDHGLESAADRKKQGKAERARLGLSTKISTGDLVIEIADDGQGVDWESVRRVATFRGLPSKTPADLSAALFSSDITTRTAVSAISGRGVGLTVVQRRVEEMGGSITVQSQASKGTTFRLVFPLTAPALAESVEETQTSGS